MIDVHAHLEDEAFNHDIGDVIERARKANVKAIVTSPICPEDVEKAFNIASRFKNYVYVSLGFDPVILDYDKFNVQLEYFKKYKDRIVALGEVGLDYYYVRDHDSRSVQERIFREWIRIARDYNLPLVVHSRSAGKYAIQIILDEGYYNVNMHAYDGSVGWALEACKKGIMFSIPPSVWFSQQKQKLTKYLPLDCLILESDAPVLSPFKGERNEPAYIVYAAKKIAEIKKVSFEDVVKITYRNTLKLIPKLSTVKYPF